MREKRYIYTGGEEGRQSLGVRLGMKVINGEQ
jgi:hypothetical protein